MQNIKPGDVVTFTEYEQAQLSGKRYIRQRMENMLVAAVIQPGEVLSSERIAEYFGEDLPNDVCMMLSVSPALRLILQDDQQKNYCVTLVEAFMKTGMQTIEFGVRAMQESQEAPSYLQFMNAFGGQAG